LKTREHKDETCPVCGHVLTDRTADPPLPVDVYAIWEAEDRKDTIEQAIRLWGDPRIKADER
jgi:hypothetical protein